MNIQKVIMNRVFRQYGLFFAGVGAAMLGQYAFENHAINKLKTEIMEKYPNKYNEINKNSKDLPFSSKKLYWTKSLEELDDSVRISGQAQKAYFDGSNRVKNNIKTVDK